jgi:hypothetical protein
VAAPQKLQLLPGIRGNKAYDTGATDTEIKVGNIMPYSGPASAYGVIGKSMVGVTVGDLGGQK